MPNGLSSGQRGQQVLNSAVFQVGVDSTGTTYNVGMAPINLCAMLSDDDDVDSTGTTPFHAKRRLVFGAMPNTKSARPLYNPPTVADDMCNSSSVVQPRRMYTSTDPKAIRRQLFPCPTCGLLADGSHQCIYCYRHVHQLDECTQPAPGAEEGAGMGRICFDCVVDLPLSVPTAKHSLDVAGSPNGTLENPPPHPLSTSALFT